MIEVSPLQMLARKGGRTLMLILEFCEGREIASLLQVNKTIRASFKTALFRMISNVKRMKQFAIDHPVFCFTSKLFHLFTDRLIKAIVDDCKKGLFLFDPEKSFKSHDDTTGTKRLQRYGNMLLFLSIANQSGFDEHYTNLLLRMNGVFNKKFHLDILIDIIDVLVAYNRITVLVYLQSSVIRGKEYFVYEENDGLEVTYSGPVWKILFPVIKDIGDGILLEYENEDQVFHHVNLL